MTEKLVARPFPAHYDFFLDFATQHNLTYPRGRALYMCNRIHNGSWFGAKEPTDLQWYNTKTELLTRMSRIQADTAQRWLEHWRAGGSIKMIGLSGPEYKARRRVIDKERKARNARIVEQCRARDAQPRIEAKTLDEYHLMFADGLNVFMSPENMGKQEK